MLRVWQNLVLLLVYAQLFNGVLGDNIWFEIVDRWGEIEPGPPTDTSYAGLYMYLYLDTKTRDPMMRTIGNGMRDDSQVQLLKNSLLEWNLFTSIVRKPDTNEWYLVPRYELKEERLRNGNIDMQIDHFFELQFAGPLILLALNLCDADPHCKENLKEDELLFGLVGPVLKGILNHERNLARIDSTINSLKASFLMGNAIPVSSESAILLGYLTEMAPIFRLHLRKLKTLIERDPEITVLRKLVYILEQTPFATGKWGDITYYRRYREGTEWKEEIILQRGPDQKYPHKFDTTQHSKSFPKRNYELTNRVDLKSLIEFKNTGKVTDVAFNKILKTFITDSIPQNKKDLCKVLSILAKLENLRLIDNDNCDTVSRLTQGCYRAIEKTLQRIDQKICGSNVDNANKWFDRIMDLMIDLYELESPTQKIINLKSRIDTRLTAWGDIDDIPNIIKTNPDEAVRLYDKCHQALQNELGFIPKGCKERLDALQEWIEQARRK